MSTAQTKIKSEQVVYKEISIFDENMNKYDEPKTFDDVMKMHPAHLIDYHNKLFPDDIKYFYNKYEEMLALTKQNLLKKLRLNIWRKIRQY